MEAESHFRLRSSRPSCHVLTAILFLSACCQVVAQGQLGSVANPSSITTFDAACAHTGAPEELHNSNRNNLKSQLAEWKLGKELAAKAEENSPMLADEFIAQYINRLELRIASRSGLPGCFVVKVVVDSEPNAFSLPGGFIYITTGLIAVLDNEGELAAALSHETAHIMERHLTKFLAQRRAWGRVAHWGGPAGYLAYRYVGPLVMFRLIRRQEFEADRVGLQYQMVSGYDSLQFCSLLQKAIPQSDDRESLLDRIYETHPSTVTRVNRLKSLSRRTEVDMDEHLVSTSEFQTAKTLLELLISPHH